MCFCVLFRFLIKDTVQSTWRHLEERSQRTSLVSLAPEKDTSTQRTRWRRWNSKPKIWTLTSFSPPEKVNLLWRRGSAVKTSLLHSQLEPKFRFCWPANGPGLWQCVSQSLYMLTKSFLSEFGPCSSGTFFFVQARNLLVHCQEIGGWFDWFIDVTFKNWKAWEGDRPLKSFEHFEPYWGDWVTQLSEKIHRPPILWIPVSAVRQFGWPSRFDFSTSIGQFSSFVIFRGARFVLRVEAAISCVALRFLAILAVWRCLAAMAMYACIILQPWTLRSMRAPICTDWGRAARAMQKIGDWLVPCLCENMFYRFAQANWKEPGPSVLDHFSLHVPCSVIHTAPYTDHRKR